MTVPVPARGATTVAVLAVMVLVAFLAVLPAVLALGVAREAAPPVAAFLGGLAAGVGGVKLIAALWALGAGLWTGPRSLPSQPLSTS